MNSSLNFDTLSRECPTFILYPSFKIGWCCWCDPQHFPIDTGYLLISKLYCHISVSQLLWCDCYATTYIPNVCVASLIPNEVYCSKFVKQYTHCCRITNSNRECASAFLWIVSSEILLLSLNDEYN
jgi:hypothetical protein